MGPNRRKTGSGSDEVSQRIASLGDWRGERLAGIRRMIHEADPEVAEDVKWKKPTNPAGVPVWSHDGIICTGEPYKTNVRVTFAHGASLRDPSGLFNASLRGHALRAIVLREGDRINERAFKGLIRAAVALNSSGPKRGR